MMNQTALDALEVGLEDLERDLTELFAVSKKAGKSDTVEDDWSAVADDPNLDDDDNGDDEDIDTALFHFREHLAGPHAKTRAQVAADCPDYRLVADVVNVTKHGTLTRQRPKGHHS